MINIVAVDNHPIVLEGLQKLLSNSADILPGGYSRSGKEILALLDAQPADIVLMDINLTDINGILLCQEIKRKYTQTGIIVLSTHSERHVIMSAIGNGASGYVMKSATGPEILQAVYSVYKGSIYFCSGTQRVLNNKDAEYTPPMPHLTRRETEILKLIGKGYTSHEIASQLFISVYTVDGHRKNLKEKFELSNMTAVIKRAAEYNII
ncbi:MAG TPA: response regulator transcription factor [Chitinophaga sp.]|uniref:response regulator transcription factor n=1 Tax=Chitinophaga sp. TaxID=1869181 RepID=UPI002C73EA6A|nr:response regulator transcription factor [Chitinophaga sp.]HVI45588.1 response regulator transcription factor [Chitinophaga sp.]